MRYADNHCTYQEDFTGGKHSYVYSGKCIMTKKVHTVRIPANELFAYRDGKYIQDAMPSVSPTDRDFLMSGILLP